jgi:hypothetical protein
MSALRVEIGLALLALSLAALGARRVQTAVVTGHTPVPVVPRALALPPVEDPDSLEAARRMVIGNDPFRLANRPPDTAFTLAPPPNVVRAAVAATPPKPARPTLVLRAIMGGPPWLAMIDGLPGQGSVTVRAGDTFEKLIVRTVTRDSVIVQAPDTTWRLTLSSGRP